MKKARNDFDKYKYYIDSVQAPDVDVVFFRKVYRQLRKKNPISLREDFCGTFIVCMEWVKLSPELEAHGVDLDLEPINYGKKNLLPKLSESQQKRIHIHNDNVLNPNLTKTDIVAAQNFSYFLFKKRSELLAYFKNAYRTLKDDGVFIVDVFGGTGCTEPNEEETRFDGYSYFWDQDSYNPITQEAQFYIHYKLKGVAKRYEKVFSYDWRMWSIPEIREVMEEAGFSKSYVYWEGTTKKGGGDGDYKITEKGEPCDSWITYIAATK